MLVLERLFDHTTSVLLYIARAPVSINSNFYIAYILSFIGLSYFSHLKYYKTERSAFFKFLFPKEIYTHKSAIGIGVDQENPHSTVAKAYYVPVVEFLREIKKKFEWTSN